jgi:pimeloyl-ACP methyl ester carboxylesterase
VSFLSGFPLSEQRFVRRRHGRPGTVIICPVPIIAAFLLFAVPAFAQPASGTTASGLFYEASGAGEPIVLIHAFSVDRRMWEPQIAAFDGRFRVVRYDLRGHGRSAAPVGPYTGYGDLKDVLDALGIQRAVLVGLSAGSEVAINFALTNPDRVSRLVLASPGLGGYRLPPLPWADATFKAAAAGDAQAAARLWAQTPIMALRKNETARDTVRSLVEDNWRLWTFGRTEQPLMPPAITRLAGINSPVLVVTGSEDLSYITDIAALIAKSVANGRHMVIPGAGHIVNLDAPSEFSEAMSVFVGQ